MGSNRMDAGTHSVLVLEGGRVLEEKAGVPAADVGRIVLELRTRHGANARILVDGADFDPQVLARLATEVAPHVLPARPAARVVAAEPDHLRTVELAHTMLWDTYDRAARVQAWMLEQASAFTLELLENNKRLADQASELQKRYQASIAEIDYMAREKMMMDAEASASRYARFLIEKARAETEAAQPAREKGAWVDDLIDGVSLALNVMCGGRAPRDPWNSN